MSDLEKLKVLLEGALYAYDRSNHGDYEEGFNDGVAHSIELVDKLVADLKSETSQTRTIRENLGKCRQVL